MSLRSTWIWENSCSATPEAYAPFISTKDQAYLAKIKTVAPKVRWIGSFVADFHRNLIKGGIFFWAPTDTSGQGNFKPKLRLTYEAKPMAFLMEQAGGAATDGKLPIMDIQPGELHQRVTVIIGNKDVVEQY